MYAVVTPTAAPDEELIYVLHTKDALVAHEWSAGGDGASLVEDGTEPSDTGTLDHGRLGIDDRGNDFGRTQSHSNAGTPFEHRNGRTATQGE
jgi:hypothetical protein